MYFWMYQPYARQTFLSLLRTMTREERIILARGQLMLVRVREVSQLFVDGLIGPAFARALAFYLDSHEEYIATMTRVCRGGAKTPRQERTALSSRLFPCARRGFRTALNPETPMPGRSHILLILSLAFMGVMGVSIILPVLPRMADHFHLVGARAGWLVAAFTLPSALATPPPGFWPIASGARPFCCPGLRSCRGRRRVRPCGRS